MSDLVWGIVLLTTLSIALFGLACFLTRNRVGKQLEFLAGVTILLLVGYVVFLWDNILMAKLLPYSNVIVLANWIPPFMGFLGGLAYQGIPGSKPKKLGYLAGLFFLAGYSVIKPLWGEVPNCHNVWRNEVCIQTSPQTCSPACAATILAHSGIETSEQEMARLCLTQKGTLWQGLYRGLKLQTHHTNWDVEVIVGDVEQLRELVQAGPVILTVGLPKESVPEIYTTRYGWSKGELHSVVLFGFDVEKGTEAQQRVFIGDPSVESGRELWSVEDLHILYRGRGLRLVPR